MREAIDRFGQAQKSHAGRDAETLQPLRRDSVFANKLGDIARNLSLSAESLTARDQREAPLSLSTQAKEIAFLSTLRPSHMYPL